MTEVLFYHLQNMSVENVLPPLLEKSLERGWRVVVQATSEERATYRRWIRGIIFFYCGLLFVAGVAVVNYSGTGRTDQTKLAVHQVVRPD